MMQFEEIIPYEAEDPERNPIEELDDDLDDHDSGSVYEEDEEQWNQDEVDLLQYPNPMNFGRDPIAERLESLYM